MSELLCPDCYSFEKSLQNPTLNYNYQNLKANFISLQDSAQQGCPLCRLIYQSSFYDENVSIQDDDAPIDIMAKDSTIDAVSQEQRLEIITVRVQQRGSADSMYLPILSNTGGQIQAFEAHQKCVGQLQDPTSTEGLEKIVHLASEWISNCRDNHAGCGPRGMHSDLDYLPTRLIDVGTEDGAQLPRLFLPDHAAKNLEYVALSYAWGPMKHVIKTTASNLQAMTDGLPFCELSKTIRDAIVFTRKLGFKYLWVDALCILQSEGPHDLKHKDDWSHEATRFGRYYQNAALTISATGATCSENGLFLPRPAMTFDSKPVVLRRERPSGETTDISILPKVPAWLTEIKKAPLYQRGWAIQERMLSTRVVHFSTNMVLWECHECRATEIDQAGLGLGDQSVVYEEVSDFMPIFRDLERKSESANRAISEWYSFVEGYTSAKFTFIGDRLPALSGIAAVIQEHTPQRYGAGLWESVIPEGLTWFVEEKLIIDTSHLIGPLHIKADTELMLPSWAWASGGGPVRFLSTLETWETSLQVENWEVKSKGENTSGQVVEARLRVRGSFKRLNLSELGFDFDLSAELGTHILTCDSEPDGTDFTRAAFMDKKLDRQAGTVNYACMLVGTATIPGSRHKQGVSGGSLILEPTGRWQDGIEEYRRVGFLCLPFDEYWREDIEQRTIELV
ncbi:hypothetical protein FLONG3_5069 [Fusarium longipes]|uniref:Heterokaryon incompatibility domain-containing protein n=1 Tax=Fusarium longipes TaxID=694270 RepID=A0A395SX97_9HYPO|nr:hypothetical protein FLONG3_5069 [Fusarium longipes]